MVGCYKAGKICGRGYKEGRPLVGDYKAGRISGRGYKTGGGARGRIGWERKAGPGEKMENASPGQGWAAQVGGGRPLRFLGRGMAEGAGGVGAGRAGGQGGQTGFSPGPLAPN